MLFRTRVGMRCDRHGAIPKRDEPCWECENLSEKPTTGLGRATLLRLDGTDTLRSDCGYGNEWHLHENRGGHDWTVVFRLATKQTGPVPLYEEVDTAVKPRGLDSSIALRMADNQRLADSLGLTGSQKAEMDELLLRIQEAHAKMGILDGPVEYGPPHEFAEPPDPEVEVCIPTLETFARALHMTDVDVMVFAAEVGEAQAQTGGTMLLERGPNVIAAVEKMWERDELGLRTKWLAHASRALELLKNK